MKLLNVARSSLKELRADYEDYLCTRHLTLLNMTDKMMKTYLSGLDTQFVTQGGIKERMYAARTGYRKGIDEDLQRLREENKRLRQQVPILEQRIEQLLNEKRHLEVMLQQEREKKQGAR